MRKLTFNNSKNLRTEIDIHCQKRCYFEKCFKKMFLITNIFSEEIILQKNI